MKIVATVAFFFLFLTLVDGAVFFVRATKSTIDGKVVIQCKVEWDGKTYPVSEGQSINLPPGGNPVCYKCDKCSKDGMSCAEQFKVSKDGTRMVYACSDD
jgi:hypothetical protein